MPPQHSRQFCRTATRCQVAPALSPLLTMCTSRAASGPPCGSENRGRETRAGRQAGGEPCAWPSSQRSPAAAAAAAAAQPLLPATIAPHLRRHLLERVHAQVERVRGGQAREQAALVGDVVQHGALAKLQRSRRRVWGRAPASVSGVGSTRAQHELGHAGQGSACARQAPPFNAHLRAVGRVADGDRQPDLHGIDGALRDQHAPRGQPARQRGGGVGEAGSARAALGRGWPPAGPCLLPCFTQPCSPANHGAKALARVGYGAAVGARRVHLGVAVEQGVARHAHAVEPDLRRRSRG